MKVLTAGVSYFAMVFGIGFLLGMIRVPILVPAVGERVAELIELPFMILAIVLSARWIVDWFEIGGKYSMAGGTGIIAAILLLSVEFTVVIWIRGMTLSESLLSRDPIAASVYYSAVAVFAAMPPVISYCLGKHKK